MPDPLKLFISYRSSDAPKVDKIANDLALLTHDDGTPCYAPWQDKKNLPPASPNWWDAIVDAIESCAVFVFHISVESLKSKVCQAELEYAHRRNRPIIPIVLEGEFFLDKVSGKYDLLKDTWPHVPDWLGERQFLFHTGADFYRQFEVAMDVFRHNWPRAIPAPRPLNPDLTNQTTSHERYDQACDFAERLAFAEAEKLFDALARRNDRHYGAVAAEWLELLRMYAELIEIDSRPRARFNFMPLWNEYTALFPKPFLEGIFDPRGFTNRDNGRAETQVPAQKGMTAAEYLERGKARPDHDTDLKIADYTEAIRLDPSLAEAYIYRGNSYYGKKEYDRAILDYNEAIRLDPQSANAYNNRGNSYHAKGEYDRAILDYSEAIRLIPWYADAHYNRGLSYKAKGDYDRAILDYNEAIRLDPQDALSYINRGISYHDGKKEYDRAILDYNEAIRLNPQSVLAYFNRGISYNDGKKEYDRAILDYNEAIRLNPQSANAYNSRGVSYEAKGEYDRAIADYDRALEIDPDHPYAANNRKNALEAKRTQKK